VINEVVTTLGGGACAVLYGGSVNPTNATELLSDPNTHGLFVGRAAWEASGFIELLKLCAPFAGAGAGQSTTYSRNLPWSGTAALL
jgi:triosephosphate isomerase